MTKHGQTPAMNNIYEIKPVENPRCKEI